ncbi:MAG TPA: LON peptidase substrate-binding domain-containing protein [Gemmatimonadales bacterium]|nr:LON peptidase substrate-binding domain-containing protein [Gemmatimonadales bacterium]
MPFRLPIFPLSVVLFPGTPLPLHIFEPRYRRMLTDCLAGDRRFGITPPAQEDRLPDPGTVGCIAEIRVNQELPDGRSNIIVLGGDRFVIARGLDEGTPYFVAMVQTFDEEPGTEPAEDDSARLRQAFAGYYALLRQLNDVEPEEPSLPDDAAGLSFHVAAAIECDPGVKQRLLVERSTARRVEALLMLVPILTASVESALRVHRRAHTNGRGGARPDVVTEP